MVKRVEEIEKRNQRDDRRDLKLEALEFNGNFNQGSY